MKNNIDISTLKAIGGDAALKGKGEDKKDLNTKAKNINIPCWMYSEHEKLKAQGKTTLNLTQFIFESMREKFERDMA